MEKPIQAGMILKTKFVAAGNDKFTEYINYIDRVEAVRNDNFQKYDLFHDGAEQLQQDSWTEGYLTYMENPEKTTGLFTIASCGRQFSALTTAGYSKTACITL